MAKYEFKQLNEMSEQRLQELLKEEQENLRKMRFQATGGDLKTVHKIKEGRKLVARILTILNMKSLQPAAQPVETKEVDKA